MQIFLKNSLLISSYVFELHYYLLLAWNVAKTKLFLLLKLSQYAPLFPFSFVFLFSPLFLLFPSCFFKEPSLQSQLPVSSDVHCSLIGSWALFNWACNRFTGPYHILISTQSPRIPSFLLDFKFQSMPPSWIDLTVLILLSGL